MGKVLTFLCLFTVLAGQARQNQQFPAVQNLGADPPRTVNVTISGQVIDYRDRPVTVGRVGLMDAARTVWRPLAAIGADGAYAIQAALVPGVYILVAAAGPYELAEKTINIVGAATLTEVLNVAREHPNAAGLLACPLANMPKQGLLPIVVNAVVSAVPKRTQPKPAAKADLRPSREFFYATDREQVTRVEPDGPRYFNDAGDPGGQLRYGTFDVRLLRKNAAGAPLATPAPISDPAVFHKLLANRARGGDLLVFVHGFRVPFEDGLVRVAELADGISFPGPIVLFSWPSADHFVRYPATRDTPQKRGLVGVKAANSLMFWRFK